MKKGGCSTKESVKKIPTNSENERSKIFYEATQIPSQPPGYKVLQMLEPYQEEFIKNVLKESDLVSEFDDDTITEFVLTFSCIEFEKGQVIYCENEEARVFYIIEEGKVQFTLENEDEVTYNEKGKYFGEECFEEYKYRKETAIAVEKSKLLCCSGEFFRSARNYMFLKQVNEKVELLKSVSLFKYLDQNKLISIAKPLTQVLYRENSIIVNEGEQNDNKVYIICSGTIRSTRKFKKIKTLKKGDYFCHIGLIMKVPCYYTYSVEEEAMLFEIPYKSLKELGVKDMIYNVFLNAIQVSQRISMIFIQNYDHFFNIFKLRYYEKDNVVFPTEISKNKKICIIISGEIRKANQKEILAKTEDVYGESIIDAKTNLDCNIISDQESLILEASWDEIVKSSENDKNNNIDLCDTVSKLKRVQIFSSFKETKFLELAKIVSKECYKDSDIISREGEIANKFYIIKSGKVKMYQKKKYIRELEEGGCFGEIPNITGEIRLFTVVACGNTECFVLTKEDLASFDDGSLKIQIQKLSYLNDVNVTLSDLLFVKILGNGRFGKVFLVHNQKHFYAIKFAKIKNICMNKNLMQYYYNEKKIMLQIDHPFILKLVKTLKNAEYLFFLLEFIDGITLKTYIEKRKKSSVKNAFETAFYGGILLLVINYLHNKRIIHRDIKPDNCMIDKYGYLKLIDFGVAKELRDKDTTSTLCGTPHYLAPEVIIGKGYSFSSDYWSLGITMFEIFYGYVPFGQSAKDAMDVYYEVLNKKLSLPYDPKNNDMNSFFKIILSKNLMHRVTNFQLLRSHPFFHDFDFEKLLSFSIKAPFLPDSFIDNNENNNVSILSVCNISISSYMNSHQGYEEDNVEYEEEYMKEKKFIDDF